jgi:hypothetical protein
MVAIATVELPKDLRRAHDRFLAWRSRRSPGSRIPSVLWNLAVRLARTHGVSRIVKVLGIDYYGLKKRADAAGPDGPALDPVFVALPAPVAVGKQCRFELDNGSGATMHVQLAGYDVNEIEILARTLWNAG